VYVKWKTLLNQGTPMAAKRRAETAQENREKMIQAARKAFAEKGYAAASMDELTASVGLTRGALYHNFSDKKGLLAAVVAQIDSEMAEKAKAIASTAENDWERLLAEGVAYIKMALVPEVQRIVLLDGPAVLGDPAQWPSQNSCLESTRHTIEKMIACDVLKPVDAKVAAHLLNGAALNAALLIAASDDPQKTLPHAIEVFTLLAGGLRNS
jgi:AcrR family transcriptional regulator